MKPMILFSLIVFSFPSFAKTEKPKTTELTVYTSRKTHLIEPIFKAYTQKTGVKVKHINGKAGALIQKIKQEGDKSPADILITVDAGNLGNAADLGLLMTMDSKTLVSQIPSQYRDKDNRWVGLSLRARTLFYDPKNVDAKELKSYTDLANEKWKGKLCLRTSRKVYNQSLVATMIQKMGEKKTKDVVKGWVNNLAMPVFTSDSLLLKAIAKGDCFVGIANTYYLARLQKKGEAKNVKVFWPSSKEGGVHVNVSGAGIVKTSSQKAEAQKLLEWLTTKEAQKLFAELNDEYPVVKGVSLSPTLKSWGEFAQDKTPLGTIGPLQKKAVMLMDSVRYR